jgi:hypothetical protein
MYFDLITFIVWAVFGMTIPFLSGLITTFFFKHKPPTQAIVNAGIFTTLVAMILTVFWWNLSTVWFLLANALLLVLFGFWWKTDESKKWVIYGVFAAANFVLNWLAYGLIRIVAGQ